MSVPPARKGVLRPTVRDVSVLAGVSRMTVTRVFIRPDQVLPATRARVQSAVAQLGYVPDRAAGSLATRRSGFVGLVLPTLNNANFAALAEGLTESLRPARYELLIGYTTYSAAEEERQIRTLLSRRPEALVLAAAPHTEAVRRLLARAEPPVIEIAELPQQPINRAIGFSNHAVGAAAARFLIGLGHRRLAALGPRRCGDRMDTRGEARLRGFTDALRAAGLSAALIRADGAIPLSFEQGARSMAALLDEAPDVEGVFAISDLSAVGALLECQRRGFGVPERLSLMGFGDFEIGRQMLPPLTTIGVDFKGLGRRAGGVILDLLRFGANHGGAQLDVGFTVIARGTTRAAFSPPKGHPHG